VSDDTSGTFGGWADRLTFIAAEGQLLVLGLAVSLGAALLLIRPSIPGVPPVTKGIFAALLLLGPPLLGLFVSGARKLRNRNMVEVFHINAVEDERRKYYVEPGVWESKTVEGPSPYRVNDESAYEVRAFDWHPDQGEDGTLIVSGCEFSQMADSKLVTVKTMIKDIHGELIETGIAYNRLRARISKMGLKIENDTINTQAEADERGMMTMKTSVKDAFESAKDDAEGFSTDEISDLGDYEHEYDPAEPDPVAFEQGGEAATDGGTTDDR